ncbi:hypothetical protein [Rhodovulum strictum]|uniref:Uncharacterized protein n=1 Tax=Rhodovulum strictum TaxID=58314 RepID=A0A844BI20_9RHOB|nr:hypothetical protein [Rhodovulum strictum]MRH22209.1 hypothetical protein [Rhodovulum strictum]
MAGPISKTTAIFERPFSLPGFAEVLPAGEYDLETEISAPPDHRDPDRWKASVLVRLHPRNTHPGLVRSLTVPLSALEDALGRDKLTGASVVDFFVDEMLADPMVQLVMRADRVSEAEVRALYARSGQPGRPAAAPDTIGSHGQPSPAAQNGAAVQAAENEGMPPRHR